MNTYEYPTPDLVNVITEIRHEPDSHTLEIDYRNYFGGDYWARATLTVEQVAALAQSGDKSAYLYQCAKRVVDFGHPDRKRKWWQLWR